MHVSNAGPHSNSQNAVRRSRLPSCMLADSGVLDDAGVIRKVHLSRDRVRKLEPSDGEATSECVGPSVNVEARVARETPSNARRPPSTSPTTHLGGDNDSEASQED